MQTETIGLALLLAGTTATADPSTIGTVANSRFELAWPSQVNHEYTIMLSTNLVEGFSGIGTVQATPPLNTWWEGLGHDARFFVIERPAVANTPGTRSLAKEVNRRMGHGNNFMAAKSMNDQGAPEDYILLNTHHFTHCRIGYKMDEVCGGAPDYLIPANEMANLKNMVDWCLSQGLIANIDPVHNWANNNDANLEYDPDDLPKLSQIWVQVATHFAGYDIENVVFEIMNEPHGEDDVAQIIATGLAAIRGVSGNETRIVIVSGDGFSTRKALIDAFDNDEIPADDDYLIGTFHYYDPKSFTGQGGSGPVNWGTPGEFAQVAADFDAVLTANTNWAVRNATAPLPIYLGEFGVDNGASATDRKAWLAWIRMQAEARGMSWAHWNMYQNTDASKGMGPWTSDEINNPDRRHFDADPVEALIGRYEFEAGSKGGGVAYDDASAGFTGTGYAAFPTNTGVGVWARIDDIDIPKDDTYLVTLHYASDTARSLRIVTAAQTISNQPFPATGGTNSWKTISIPVAFSGGETASLKVVATPDEGVLLDWLRVSKQSSISSLP